MTEESDKETNTKRDKNQHGRCYSQNCLDHLPMHVKTMFSLIFLTLRSTK